MPTIQPRITTIREFIAMLRVFDDSLPIALWNRETKNWESSVTLYRIELSS